MTLWTWICILSLLVVYEGYCCSPMSRYPYGFHHWYFPKHTDKGCDFDSSFCSWKNDKNSELKWTLKIGQQSAKSGTGCVVIDSTQDFFYDERAILTRDTIDESFIMTFYYRMSDDAAETLIVKTTKGWSNHKEIVWARYGNQGNDWKKGCVEFKDITRFKVFFEATLGASNMSSIYLDEIKTHDTLDINCKKSEMGIELPTETQTALNCRFYGTLCGWRILKNRISGDGILWMHGKESGNSKVNGNGSMDVFTSLPNQPIQSGIASIQNSSSIQNLATNQSISTKKRLAGDPALVSNRNLDKSKSLVASQNLTTNQSQSGSISLAANQSLARNITLATNQSPADNITLATNQSLGDNISFAANQSLSGNISSARNQNMARNITLATNQSLSGNISLVAANQSLASNQSLNGNISFATNQSMAENKTLAANQSPGDNISFAGNQSLARNITLATNQSLAINENLGTNQSVVNNSQKLVTNQSETNTQNSPTKSYFGDKKAYLISPRLWEPRCLNLSYQIYGKQSFLNVILLRQGKTSVFYKTWTRRGRTKQNFTMINLPYSGPYQVLLIGGPSLHGEKDVVLFSATFRREICTNEQISSHAGCDFENNMCMWYNERGDNFDWVRISKIDSRSTNNKHSTYLSAKVKGKKDGKKARISSLWMTGSQCMQFSYYSYGKNNKTLGGLTIYARTNRRRNTLLAKYRNKDEWQILEAHYNSPLPFKFGIEITRSQYDVLGDLAIDDISFRRGKCNFTEILTYILSTNGRSYHMVKHEQSSNLNGFYKILKLQVKMSMDNQSGRLVCFYKRATKDHNVISTEVSTDHNNFPLDCFHENTEANQMVIYLFTLAPGKYDIQEANKPDSKCCSIAKMIAVQSVARLGRNDLSECDQGWYKLGNSCLLVAVDNQINGWKKHSERCIKMNSRLVSFQNPSEIKEISRLLRKLHLPANYDFFTGYSLRRSWRWSDGKAPVSKFWGIKNNVGNCAYILSRSWYSSYCDGYAYRFICEKLDSTAPVAVYPLNSDKDVKEASSDSTPRGKVSLAILKPGPNGDINGSIYLNGFPRSFVNIFNKGYLDVKFSFTITLWIFPELTNSSGTVIAYKDGLELSITNSKYLSAKFAFKRYKAEKLKLFGLQNRVWSHVGFSYDYMTGWAKLWIGNYSVSKRLGEQKELAASKGVRVGSAFINETRSFVGRISDLRIYDFMLSDNQRRNSLKAIPKCQTGFEPIRGKCFLISKRVHSYNNAVKYCESKGATLAKVDREYIRSSVVPRLQYRVKYWIGLTKYNEWYSPDGGILKYKSWKKGQSYVSIDPLKAVLRSAQERAQNTGGLCRKHGFNMAFKAPARSSSEANNSSASFAVDGDRETCFDSKKEDFPFLKIHLQRSAYVLKVVLALRKSCCKQQLNLSINIEDGKETKTPCLSEYSSYVGYQLEYNCPIVLPTLHVTLTRMERNSTLQICEIRVYELGDYHGALQEIWFHKLGKVSLKSFKLLTKEAPPAALTVMKNFEASMDIADNNGQRLSAFLMIPSTGNHYFYMSCMDSCVLMYKIVPDLIFKDEKMQSILEPETTDLYDWNGDKSQMSPSIFLHRCALYRLEAYTVTKKGHEHMSVGIRIAKGGKLERPIPGSLLLKTLTGNRTFSISFKNSAEQVTVEVDYVKIHGSYRFCCNGVYCPSCPLQLFFNSTKILIGSLTEMTCNETKFAFVLKDYFRLGEDSLEIAFDLPKENVTSKTVGTIEIKAVTIEKCSFEDKICPWLNTDGSACWEISSHKTRAEPLSYIELNKTCKSTLKSNELPWYPYHMNTSLCLEFSYRMSSKGALSVIQYSRSGTKLLWNLTGYQGETWQKGRVQLTGINSQKVGFQGQLEKNGNNVLAITNITVTTQTCERHPTYSRPGLILCKGSEFQCDNGQCIDRKLKCDGDKHCIDESDEIGCQCPSGRFLCPSGECINAELLCDRDKDCKDGADEINCDHGCKAKFQCVDGNCIDWTNTCRKERLYCKENSHNPNICASSNCTLENLGCTAKLISSSKHYSESSMGKTISVPCSFVDGLCGFTQNIRSQRKWIIWKGSTPTQDTGPSFDHTTLSDKESYIYIEASDKTSPLKKARLESCWFDSNRTQCLQFWYHMYGSGIGSLKIIRKTAISEETLWHQAGNKGNLWRFGQITLEGNDRQNYQFIIEGATTGRIQGDIAVDDIALHDGACSMIYSQGHPPNCRLYESCELVSHIARMIGHPISCWLSGSCDSGYLIHLKDIFRGDSIVRFPLVNRKEYTWKCFHVFFVLDSHRKFFIYVNHGQKQTKYIISTKPGINFAEFPLHNVTDTKVSLHHYRLYYWGFKFFGRFSSSVCLRKEKLKKQFLNEGSLAVYPLNSNVEGRDILNRNPSGLLRNVFPDKGPDGAPEGAYRFIGIPESYIEFRNKGGLNAKSSLTLLAWIKLTGDHGPIFNYDTKGGWVYLLMNGKDKLYARFSKRNDFLVREISHNGVKHGVWQYVGATYDSKTGIGKLFITDRFVVSKFILKNVHLATDRDVRMGARIGDGPYFEGSISCMQVYGAALSQKSIISLKERCFQTTNLCLWFDISCYWKTNSTSHVSWIKTNRTIKQPNLNDATGVLLDDDFELHLSPSSLEEVEIHRHEEQIASFTICLWKKGGGIYVRYRSQQPYLWLNISEEIIVDVLSNKNFSFGTVNETKSWQFYCFSLTEKDENCIIMSFYKNGEINKTLLIEGDDIEDVLISHGKHLVVGYLPSQINGKAVLSSFNIWRGELSIDQIKSLSYGCGGEKGDLISWREFSLTNHFDHKMVKPKTCKDAKKERLVLRSSGDLVTVQVDQQTTSNTIGFCLRFRYIIYGPRASWFQVSILSSLEEKPLSWKDNDNTQFRWKYANVPFISPGVFQVKFKGIVDPKGGYIAISKVFVENRFCRVNSSNLNPDCRKEIQTAPGIIAHQYHPYVLAMNISCWWYIKAPPNQVIRFTFLEFVLPYDRGCNDVYLQIYDRNQKTGSSLGRFCGYIYPDFVQSSSNMMTIKLHAPKRSEPTRGFKARYEFLKVNNTQKDSSVFVKDCPSSCRCTSLAANGNQTQVNKVIVEARPWLNDIPKTMPRLTAALMFRDKKITRIKGKAFSRLPSLTYMDLSWNHIFDIEEDAFFNGSSLESIRLNNNFIKSIPGAAFLTLRRLKTLDLGENLLTGVTESTLTGLTDLKVLSLRSNRIKSLQKDLLRHTVNMSHLYLQDNGISSLPDGTFRFLHKLIYMNLSQNRISSLNRYTFQGLKSLKYLDLRGNKLSKVEQDAFVELSALKDLNLDAFIYCCYAKKSIPGITCLSTESNEFSSCDDLMKNQVLRVFIWILGIFAVFGNMLVIVRRIRSKNSERDTQSFFLFNLAIADFLMGVYLIIIAVADIQWKGEYFKYDLSWRSGTGCAIAGILSMLSSVVSVVMLAIVTCDRLICIIFPFSTRKITRRHAAIISGCLWIFGLVSSVLPVMNLDYFKTTNDEFDFGFYGRSSVCLPAQLSPERLSGWEYAAAFFLGLPFIAFMFMLMAYIVIFYRVSKSSSKIRSTAVNRESSLAKKLVFIILTDFMCWMPVIVIGTLALTRTFYDPTKQVYVWIAIFVLPINSSINPFLYTFSNVRRTSQVEKKRVYRLSLYGIKRIKNISNSVNDCTVSETFYSGEDMSRQGSKKSRQTSPKTSQPLYQIEIQEEMNIQKYHSGVGYALAKITYRRLQECCLIKYFDEDMEDAWEKELGFLSLINQHRENIDEGSGVCLARYKWHCTANEHSVTRIVSPEFHDINNSALICFDYTENKCLHDYLENQQQLAFITVCSLCIDIMSTIEFLQKCGISNNNINTRAIVVRKNDSQDAQVRAVIVDFSRATILQKYEDGSYAKADILQFRFLFRVLLRKCREDCSRYQQIDDILSLCKYERKVDTAESIKYCLTRALIEMEEALDTKL